MYSFKRSVIAYNTGAKGLQPFDVSGVLLNKYRDYFTQVWLVLNDLMYDAEICIQYTNYAQEFDAYNGTIADWLATKANTPLTTVKGYPGTEFIKAKFYDAQYQWFTPNPGDASRHTNDQHLITLYEAPDIRMHKTDNSAVDYKALNDYTLWLMNGHVSRSVADDTDIYLINAGKNYKVNTNITIGVINFKGIGKVSTSPIKAEDIKFTVSGQDRHLKVKTKEVLKDKTVWMVIGGRLYMNDVVRVTSDNSVTINFTGVDWFEKMFTSREWIDLQDIIPREQKSVPKNYFRSEAFFMKLLTHPSTFFVTINNPYISTTSIPLREYQFPFTYHTERSDDLPMLLANGLIPCYQRRKIVNEFLLDIDAGFHKRYLYHTAGEATGDFIHGTLHYAYPHSYARAYLLEIKSLFKGD